MSLPAILGGEPVAALRSSWPVCGDREAALTASALASGRWSGEGPMEREFESSFAGLHTAAHGLCVANGTVALQLALEALDVGVGDEVVVPGLTWQATAAAVLDVNATPVLVDVAPQTLCLEPALVEAAITPRTKAIVPVHLYGAVADLDAIGAIAERHGLAVIEDCAHAHGACWRDRGVGSTSAVGAFSFQASKTLTAGEGGFVTSGDDRIYERLYSLRNCGRRRPASADADWTPIQSGNYRMTELQAAVLLGQLERFEDQRRRRAAGAAALDGAIGAIAGISPQRCDERVTRRSLYAYAFDYDPAAFAGLSAASFRRALELECGVAFRAPYRPLDMSALYRPQTKRRHRLGAEYWAAIDPSRHSLPAARRAHEQTVVFSHEVLLEDPADVLCIATAIERLRASAEALRAWELGEAAAA
ncbi:MAG: aminotransferase class I/II-fold pyridoxal phosphate-dependent enzyme [Solirubrobacteraceae bacterium]